MAQTTSDGTMAEFLADHPRMMGGLFTICLLLTEAGNVAANVANANNGP